MKGLFVLMKSGFFIFGIVVAPVMLWGYGSKSSPTGAGGGNTLAGMVSLPGGTFQMGSNNTSLESFTGNDEEPVHSVTVSSFYMDSTDVTQASYQALMGVNPSYFDTGAWASQAGGAGYLV